MAVGHVDTHSQPHKQSVGDFDFSGPSLEPGMNGSTPANFSEPRSAATQAIRPWRAHDRQESYASALSVNSGSSAHHVTSAPPANNFSSPNMDPSHEFQSRSGSNAATPSRYGKRPSTAPYKSPRSSEDHDDRAITSPSFALQDLGQMSRQTPTGGQKQQLMMKQPQSHFKPQDSHQPQPQHPHQSPHIQQQPVPHEHQKNPFWHPDNGSYPHPHMLQQQHIKPSHPNTTPQAPLFMPNQGNALPGSHEAPDLHNPQATGVKTRTWRTPLETPSARRPNWEQPSICGPLPSGGIQSPRRTSTLSPAPRDLTIVPWGADHVTRSGQAPAAATNNTTSQTQTHAPHLQPTGKSPAVPPQPFPIREESLGHQRTKSAVSATETTSQMVPQTSAKIRYGTPDTGADPPNQLSSRNGSRPQKICQKCTKPITGQFVRALGAAHHIECFTCDSCGVDCAARFFPISEDDGPEVPLCEHCYFKRLNLLCFKCGEALRGSYITALDRKYHVDHFKCSCCSLVFGPEDSYYEHKNEVYCHYHYWTLYASKCEGCRTAILKQFVETYRGGREHQWHPECYMIYKFWNVKLSGDLLPLRGPDDSSGGSGSGNDDSKTARQDRANSSITSDSGAENGSYLAKEAQLLPLESTGIAGDAVTQEQRDEAFAREKLIDGLVFKIWTTLCTFEERTAASISSLIQATVSFDVQQSLSALRSLIGSLQSLFDAIIRVQSSPGAPRLGRESKSLCRKLVSFMSLVSKLRMRDTTIDLSSEILIISSSIAHYLKSIIKYGLSAALALDRQAIQKVAGTASATTSANSLHPILERFLQSVNYIGEPAKSLPPSAVASDRCISCEKSVEDKCFRWKDLTWHLACFKCAHCQEPLAKIYEQATLMDLKLFCRNCLTEAYPQQEAELAITPNAQFTKVHCLQQYLYLLRVALTRLEIVVGASELTVNSNDDELLEKPVLSQAVKYLDSSFRSSSELSSPARAGGAAASVEAAVAARSQAVSAADAAGVQPVAISAALGRTSSLLQSKPSLTLDDIQRIVAAERAREQMPNAFRHQEEADDMLTVPLANNADPSTILHFGTLSHADYQLVQQIASVLLIQLLSPSFVRESEINDLLDVKQRSLWEKVGKALAGGSRKRGCTFGVQLETLIERHGSDSTYGVGSTVSYRLRVPAVVDSCISVLRTKDMSTEGVFRKNGNIRRIREMTENIDRGADLKQVLQPETPIQICALLKRFLRDMPSPLMGARLAPLWILVTRVPPESRAQLLQLLVCILNRPYRDLLEVLVAFFSWTASFANLDDDHGSKMDHHNLATVIAPNLFPPAREGEADTYLQAIEPLSLLIKQPTLVSRVPADVQSILKETKIAQQSDKLNARETTEFIRQKSKEYAEKPSVV